KLFCCQLGFHFDSFSHISIIHYPNGFDMTTLFAGLALQARRRFGIAAQHLHIDTTSFSVSGDYASKEEGDPVPIDINYGYSRDHREERTAMDARARYHP